MGLMKRLVTGRMFGQPIPASLVQRHLETARDLPNAPRRVRPVEAVATAVRRTIAREDGSGTERPLWFLMPGGTPIAASGAKGKRAEAAIYFAREGDKEWRPIGEI